MKKRGLLIGLTSICLSLGTISLVTSCSCDDPSEKVVNVSSVELKASTNSLKVGQTSNLETTISPEDATNKNVTYTSSDETIATVSASGVVTALKPGNVTITVTTEDGNKTSSINLTVVEESEVESGLTIDKVSEILDESPYTSSELSEATNFGLSDATNVGVNQSEIVEKYTIPNFDEIDNGVILALDELTLEQIKTVIPEATELNDYYRFEGALLLAKKENDNGNVVKIVLPSRTLEINGALASTSAVFNIDGANGIYVEGNNATFLISISGLNWKGFLNATNSKDVILKDFTIDFAMPSTLTGSVVSSDSKNRTISIDVDSEFNELCKRLSENKISLRSYLEFDLITNAPRQGGNFVVDGFSGYDIKEENGKYQIVVHFISDISVPGNGDLVNLAFTQYDAVGISLSNDENFKVENVTMHHASGMAFVASETKDLLVNRFNLKLKENSSSLMTATADGFHFDKCSGKVSITNCLLENSHDDALNIKQGYWYSVNSVSASQRKITLSKITGEMPLPKVGDEFLIYNEETFESYNPSDGAYTIEAVEEDAYGNYVLTVEDRIRNSSTWGNARATFISDVPEFTFKNNIVRNKRNRGIIVQIPNSLIENNTFENVGHGSIQCASAMDQYNECTIPNGVQIRNNKFINNGYLQGGTLLGDVSVFAISNNASVAPKGTVTGINIENNYFTRNGNSAISLRGVGDTDISNNLFDDCSRTQPSGDVYNTLIHLYNVEDIRVSDSYNNYTLGEGLSGITMQGLATEDDVTLTDNQNIGFKVNEDQGPDVDISKMSTRITIDGSLNDWTDENIHDVEIMAYSDANGEEVNPTDIESTFKINALKLAYGDEGIYLGFDIYDNELNFKTINDFWLGDSIEVFISNVIDMPSADMMVYKDQGAVLQTAFAPTWTSNGYFTYGESRTNSNYLDKAIEVAFNVRDDGYSGEVLYSFENYPELKTSIESGERICMAIIAADAERSNGQKRIQAGNVPHFVEDYKTKTQRMPRYLFKN